MFKLRDLSVHSYANGMTLWHYKAETTRAEMLAPGFFASVADMLTPGDFMMISASDGGALLYVTGADANGVRVAEMCRTAAAE